VSLLVPHLKTDFTGFHKEVATYLGDTEEAILATLNTVGITLINWLRSSDGENGTQPPVRKGEGPRDAHPGGWADNTGRLNRNTLFKVLHQGNQYVLRLYNNTSYAIKLDEKDGYFVLSGVIDGPDTPGYKLLETMLKKALPDWSVKLSS